MIHVTQDWDKKEIKLTCDCGNTDPSKFSRYVRHWEKDKNKKLAYMCSVCTETISPIDVEIAIAKLKRHPYRARALTFLRWLKKVFKKLTAKIKALILNVR